MTILVHADMPRTIPCPLAFVGEAPGEDEVLGQPPRPLIGPSGKVHDAMLRTAGLDRGDFYHGNVFEEKADDNDVSTWLRDPAIFRPALKRLRAEMLKVQPTVIVPLGGTALWAFTNSDAISQARGAVALATDVVPGVKLLPTWHPAHVMRQWKFFSVVVGDYIKAAEEAKVGPEIIYPHRELLLVPTLAEIEAYMPSLFASDLLSVDIETGWGQITCIGFAPDSTRAICIPFFDRRQPNRSYWGSVEKEVRAWQLVKRVMECDAPKLGQNFGAYDAYWLLEKMGIRSMNLLHDTRLIHHALYPELPKDLAFLGASYTQQGPWKTMRQQKATEKRDD